MRAACPFPESASGNGRWLRGGMRGRRIVRRGWGAGIEGLAIVPAGGGRRVCPRDSGKLPKASHGNPGDRVLGCERDHVMPVVNYHQYCQMLDRAKQNKFAYPAFNVTSSETANAVLLGLKTANSDGIVQISTGGAEF